MYFFKCTPTQQCLHFQSITTKKTPKRIIQEVAGFKKKATKLTMQYCVESCIQFFVVGYEKIIDFLEKMKHTEISEILKEKNNFMTKRLIRF